MAFSFVDLFAGCGGLSLGLVQAGGTGVLAIEKSKDAFKTLQYNLVDSTAQTPRQFQWAPGIPIQEHDIRSLLQDYREPLMALSGNIDVVVGGPPCQGFSNYGQRKPSDVRNFLYLRYLEFVKLVCPSVVLLENVEGINMPFIQKRANTNRQCKETTAFRIQTQLEKLGYASVALRLCASNYGVPQRRPRFFIVGVRGVHQEALEEYAQDDFIQGLTETHLHGLGMRPGTVVTTKQAISDLECAGRPIIPSVDTARFLQISYSGPRTNYQQAMHSGLSKLEAPNSMRLARHKEATLAKFDKIHAKATPGHNIDSKLRLALGTSKFRTHLLASGRPAPTITTLPDDFVHYAESRILTVREAARLQSFPDWFAFQGKYTSGGERRKADCPRYTQVGNAVPPRMAAFLGLYVEELLQSCYHGRHQRRLAA